MTKPFNHYFKEESNMTTNDAREIVRYLEDGDRERGFPCFVHHRDAGGPCERPATMTVYGLPFCEVHGEEARAGALEEMHQDADEFFTRFTTSHVPELPNPLLRSVVEHWGRAIPEGLECVDYERTDELLLAAFPFREDRVVPETAGEIADPIDSQDPPYDAWMRNRYEIHILMRHAWQLGLTYAVEALEPKRESIAAQAAFAVALDRGDHPEVLERAHRENLEDARKVEEHFARKQ